MWPEAKVNFPQWSNGRAGGQRGSMVLTWMNYKVLERSEDLSIGF